MHDYYIIFTALLIFALAPFLPDVVYDYFIDTYVGIFVFLCISLYTITYGYLPAVTVFTAVAGLYGESHSRKANKVKTVDVSNNSIVSQAINSIQNAPKLVSFEEHPAMETPDEDVVTFTPKSSDDSDIVKKADSSINEKEALPTISLSKDAEAVYEENNLSTKLD
jgi:hypothetical protein